MSTPEQKAYNPNHLLDFIMATYSLKNDAALARKLQITPPVVSKIRHLRVPISAALLILIHEMTGKSVKELREIMGCRRQNFRLRTVKNHPKRAVKAVELAVPVGGHTSMYHPAMAA